MDQPAFAELGAVAVLGASFLFIVRWMTDQMTSKLNEVSRSIRMNSLVQLDMHKMLIHHDGQTRGLSASLEPAEQTEVYRIAADHYSRMLSTLESTSEAIKAMK